MSLIAYSDRVFGVPGLLTSQECVDLIDLAQRNGFAAAAVRTPTGQKAMPLVRNNERTIFEHPLWVAELWRRISGLQLPCLEGEAPVGLPKALRFYKYSNHQRFKMHKDGPWHEDGLSSRLTFLLYLNADFSGGTTDFRDFSVSPTPGSALFFIHDTWHEGSAVTAGTKYVLRSDVLYAPTASA